MSKFSSVFIILYSVKRGQIDLNVNYSNLHNTIKIKSEKTLFYFIDDVK